LADLQLHPGSVKGATIPLADELSFKLFTQLKKKYTRKDTAPKTSTAVILYHDITQPKLANAS